MSANITQENGRKATIVYGSDFGFSHHVVEVRLHAHGTRKYAQYDHAVFAQFTPKRKRNKRGITQGYRPSLVILEGWVADRVNMPSTFGEPEVLHGIVSRRSRATSCDESWDREAAAAVASSGAEIIADYRGFNTHRGLHARRPLDEGQADRFRWHAACGPSAFHRSPETSTQRIDRELYRKGWLYICEPEGDHPTYEVPPCANRAFFDEDGAARPEVTSR